MFLFLLLLQVFLILLSDIFDLQQLSFELNFFLKFHLDYKSLVIIDHEVFAHFFDLPSELGVVKLGVLQLSVAIQSFAHRRHV